MNQNQIDWSTLDLDDLHLLPLETMEILVRQIYRMRNYLNTNRVALRTADPLDNHLQRSIFFDVHVTMLLDMGEDCGQRRWPRHILERIVKYFYMAMPDEMTSINVNPFAALP